MKWLLQLKLILWKNFLLRKRQKIRCIAEFLWPLFLFMILMWVRTRGLKSYIHECNFMEKAMPSAGSLPFLQSFLCSFNNTCHRTVNKTKVHPINLDAQELIKLATEIKKILSEKEYGDSEAEDARRDAIQTILNIGDILRQNISEDSQLFTYGYKEKLAEDQNTLNNLLDWGPKQLHDKNPSVIGAILNSNTLRQLEIELVLSTPREDLCPFAEAFSLSNFNEYKSVKFITTLCDLPESDYITILTMLRKKTNDNQQSSDPNSNITRSGIFRQLIQNYNKLSTYSQLLNSSQSETTTESAQQKAYSDAKIRKIIMLFHTFLCGNESSDILTQVASAVGQTTAFDSLQDQFKDKVTIIYHYDNTTTPGCNKLMKFIQKVPPLRVFWDIIKPFVMGKIIFTPVTNATQKLMNRVNETFNSMRDLKDFFDIASLQVDSNNVLEEDLFSQSISLAKDFIGRLVSNNTVAAEDNALFGFFQKQLSGMNTSSEDDYSDSNEDDDGPFNLTSIFECLDTQKVEGIDNKFEAQSAATVLLLQNKLWALIEFHDPGEDELNPLIKYSIRMNVDKVDDTNYIKDKIESPGPRMRPTIDLKYLTYGFAYVQDLLDRSIIAIQSGNEKPPGIIFQQFPYPCYIYDRFIHAVSRTFPLFMVLSWVYTCSMIVKAIVYEKEQRLKETMRVMGLSNGIHWAGWLIDSLIPMFITNICLSIILVYGKVLTYSDPTLLFVFLCAFSLATVSQSFLISVFFSRANLAAACAGTIFFVLYLPYTFILRWMNSLLPYQKALLSLSSNVALGVGSSYFAYYEERGIGANWDNFAHSPVYGDEFNLAYVIYLLFFDFVLYLLLAIYIEAVFPGQYGIPKPWYFPITISYWTGRTPRKVFVKSRNSIAADNDASEDNFESEPSGLTLGVSITNLTKVYSNGKKAVNNITLNFYEDHITSFLGHNGAGKTTTISILTGMYNPTSGTAHINGLDIRTEMDQIRNSLGMCPQYNVLFNRLTVEEHLLFYGRLRAGLSQSEESVRQEIDNMLRDLDLLKKRHSLPKDLSGGMQRKLSISVAFIGGSKTVILDEPTSGVDPYSRRSIWELLVKYKKGRTIILTTHFMDEADLLGDRIAIIANGRLQCCGSGVFLKSRLGDGYRLTLDMSKYSNILVPQINGTTNNDYIEDPNVSAVVKQVREIIPNAQFVEQIGAEATIVLPRSNDILTIISLLNYVEKNMVDMNIASYGISDTSLEEIFLRVAEKGDPAIREMTRSSKAEMTMFSKLYRYLLLTKTPKQFDMDTVEKPMIKDTTVPGADNVQLEKEQSSKYWRQFWALHIKRFHHTKRNRKALFSELVLPAVFVCLSIIVCSFFPAMHERPSLEVTPFVYPQPRYMFYSSNNSEESKMEPYINGMNGPVGLGTYCMEINGTKNSGCINPSHKTSHNSVFYKQINWTRCSCSTGAQVCPDNIGEPSPPQHSIASGDTMYNMNNQNISKWIVNTWPKYTGRRYGGYTFGENIPAPEVNLTDIIEKIYYAYEFNGQYSLFPLIEQLQNAKTSSNNIKVWFNNKGWVSSVGYMSAISNVILRASINSSDSSKYGIITYNHPMNYTQNQLRIEMIRQGGLNLLLAISIIFSLSFIPASFTLYLIEDRVTNSKHLQLVSGVNRFIYWIQTFSWDFIAYLVSSFLCIIIFLIFKEEAYVSETNFPGLILLFILYGWSCIPLMYPISFMFDVPSSAFVSLSCANVFVGSITTITTFVLANFDDPELKAVDNVIKEVFLIFPHFCLGDGLIKLATMHLYTAAFISYDIKVAQNILAWDVIGKNLVCMFVEGIVFSLITLAVEFKFVPIPFWRSCKRKVDLAEYEPSFEEDDVKAERLRISRNQASADTLVIKDLSKMYSGAQIPSVNKVSVGVKHGECFGLLGLNGAGKTTTFKMLTGAINPTSGDATVKGRSIVSEIDSVRALLGYCPQFDALDSLLTPREHLLLYGRIKNIPSDRLNQDVDEWLRRLSLGHYSDKLAGTLSGGNKRKLSTAIALLGNPSLIFLDEPTSGMDPKARRFLWTCIQDLVREGCCVILTSHSMEECQALCTKLTIMVNGQFKCLGTSQHLKNKYGGGYSIVIRCCEEKLLKVRGLVEESLENAKLIEAHYNQLRYQIGSRNVSSIFKVLEDARASGLIIDYSLSQTTLEDVFMRFANEQSEVVIEDSKKNGSSCFRNVLCCCSSESTRL